MKDGYGTLMNNKPLSKGKVFGQVLVPVALWPPQTLRTYPVIEPRPPW